MLIRREQLPPRSDLPRFHPSRRMGWDLKLNALVDALSFVSRVPHAARKAAARSTAPAGWRRTSWSGWSPRAAPVGTLVKLAAGFSKLSPDPVSSARAKIAGARQTTISLIWIVGWMSV